MPTPPDHYTTIHCGYLLVAPGADGTNGKFQDHVARFIKNGRVGRIAPDDGKRMLVVVSDGPQPINDEIDLKPPTSSPA